MPSCANIDPWKKVRPSSVSDNGLKVSTLISGLVCSVDLIVKSVCSKLPSKKLSIELKDLSFTYPISAKDTVAEVIIKIISLANNFIEDLAYYVLMDLTIFN